MVKSRVEQPVTVVVLGYGFPGRECERRPAPGRPGELGLDSNIMKTLQPVD